MHLLDSFVDRGQITIALKDSLVLRMPRHHSGSKLPPGYTLTDLPAGPKTTLTAPNHPLTAIAGWTCGETVAFYYVNRRSAAI